MSYLQTQDRIRVDQRMYELQKHGTKEFPFQVYFNDFPHFRDHLEDWHCHAEMEFTVALKGAFECGLNERRYRIEAGEGIFVNSGVLHMYRALGKYEDSESISIVFLPQFLSGGTENLIFHKFIEPVMEDAGLRGEPLRRGSGWQEELLVCLRRLYCLSREDGWLTEMRLRNQLSQAWELFIRNYARGDEAAEKPSREMIYEERARRILQFIQEHYCEDITVEDVAEQVHISRTECFRCFRKITGQSPKSYLNSYRIRQAMRQLETTDDSITAICFSCGFNSMSYFVKRFRESAGISPGKYRELTRRKGNTEELNMNTQQKKGDQEHA